VTVASAGSYANLYSLTYLLRFWCTVGLFVCVVDQLLLGSPDNQLSQFHLSAKPDTYFYTSQGGSSKV